jgi:Fic family protein
MAYIEKKMIAGHTYYYLTEIKRVGKNKWKKTRKYLGTKPIAKIKSAKPKVKPHFTKQQANIIERIKSSYSKDHKMDSSLWKTERERIVSFIFNTNAIEGNTLTYEETDSVLRGKIPAKAKKRDVKEVQNMKECIDFLFEYNGDIDEELVLKLHSIEMKGVLPDAGHYRSVNVVVGDYFPPVFQEVPKKMTEFFKWYRSAKQVLNPFELAALVHLKFVRIHPFRDGNGRMSRLLMNFILLKKGYPLLNIFDAEKMLYYLVLKKVDYTKKEKPFVDYLFEVFVNQYKEFV